MSVSRLLRPLTVVATASALAVPVSAPAVELASSPDTTGGPRWHDVPTGSTARLRGLAAVDSQHAWVSGSQGTVLRTDDGGRSWQDVSPGGDTTALDFRDVEAFDGHRAVVLSIGPGGASRIYRTSDGGGTWHQGFTNPDESAFYDCLSFWDDRHGIAVSDPVDGRFRVLSTRNGGRSWTVVDPDGMPAALPGEQAFAASGSCLVTAGRRDAWFATGIGARSRVFRSADHGLTWSATATPVAATGAGGIFSLAVRALRPGRYQVVAVGGDYLQPQGRTATSAFSRTSGQWWTPGGELGGFRSGASWLGLGGGVLLAVGPTGSDVSTDSGRSWRTFDPGSLDSVQCTPDGACWAAGEQGRVARLRADRS